MHWKPFFAVSSLVVLTSFAGGQTPPASTPPQPSTQSTQAPQQSGAPLKLEALPDGPSGSSQQPGAGAAPGAQAPAQPGSAGQPAPQESQQAALAQQIRQLAGTQAKWGPAMSTPGVSLAVEEVSRNKAATGTTITYQMRGTGFTPEMQLKAVRWPLNAPITTIADGLTVDAKGLVICPATAAAGCNTTKAGDPVQVTVQAAKGEVVRLAVIANDQKHGAAGSVTPFPIAAEDKGCKLEVMLGTKDAEMVLVHGQGFQPSSPITLDSESLGEKHPLNGKTDDKGMFTLATLPYVVNNNSGDTKLTYTSPGCAPTLSFHWGKNTYQAQ